MLGSASVLVELVARSAAAPLLEPADVPEKKLQMPRSRPLPPREALGASGHPEDARSGGQFTLLSFPLICV
jgi:hypothetical protein